MDRDGPQPALEMLVILAQQGNLEAFGEIVRRFRDMAYASAYTLLDDVHLAEDVMQEAFIEAYLNLGKLREPAAFPGWFKRILFKQGDRLTRGKQFRTVPLEPTATFDIARDELNPACLVEHGETQYMVQQAINALPAHERIVTQLFYKNGYPLKDIAAFLEVPVNTLKKRLFDARKHLKEQLQPVVRETRIGQRSSDGPYFPAHLQLFIAIRTGDSSKVRMMLEHLPFLINHDLSLNNRYSDPTIWQTGQYPYAHQISGHNTALLEAVKSRHLALVTLLLDYGANCEVRGNDGLTPLQRAIVNKDGEAVRLLLAHGTRVQTPSAAGLLALHLSALLGTCEIAKQLLAHHAEVNALDQGRRTPLHWATLRGHKPMVALLLAHGASQTLQDELQQTPLDLAHKRNDTHLITLLQEA